MFPKRLYFAILALALATVACSININAPDIHLPIDRIQTGPTQTVEIRVPLPDAEEADLRLAFAAGRLKLSPGAEGSLIEGTAMYNVERLAPVVDVNGDRVEIRTGEMGLRGVPNIRGEVENEWDLQLGSTPIHLELEAGAYQGEIELGGLALRSLRVGDGAAEVRVRFSEPNLTEMDSFRYETGASTVRLMGLANANFRRMEFRSGAGDYTLEFSGDLQRDAEVEIESGISQVTIVVPEGVSARVVLSGGVSNVEIGSGWQQSGDSYVRSGSGPTITINVQLVAGNLALR